MKTKSVLMGVLMSVSAMAFASGPSFKVAVVNQKESGIFKIIYEGETKGDVKLNVLNSAGTVVYHETLKDVDNFMRPLNFGGMAYGEYSVELVDNTGKKVQVINYATPATGTVGNVRVSKTAEAGKYLLAVANAGVSEMNVKIYDGASELVHSQTVSVNGSLGLIYNLKKISGEPTFTVTDKAGTVQVIK